MPGQLHFVKIDAVEAINAVNATLRRIDERLIDHGERVAFIACELCEAGRINLDMKTLFLLSVFHDVGAYKTDEIDRMVEFETKDVMHHSIYGYLFLKYMTPLCDYAKAILYHHTSWKLLSEVECMSKEYASLIHLADRIDIAVKSGAESSLLKVLFDNENGMYKDEYAKAAKEFYGERKIAQHIADGSYRRKNLERCSSFVPSAREALEYLNMIVYAIDFRSEHTVTHTINTVAVALNIARHFGLDNAELEKIYLGSLLHDVGKIAIPVSILENPGRLDDAQMKIMRTHVVETKKLICGIVSEEICEIAVRHHEKLDGSGYPKGIFANDLTFSQRIVAVADIVSALSGRRSYKESFPKDKTISILSDMSGDKLDESICDYVAECYDEIMQSTEESRLRVIRQYQGITKEFDELAASHI